MNMPIEISMQPDQSEAIEKLRSELDALKKQVRHQAMQAGIGYAAFFKLQHAYKIPKAVGERTLLQAGAEAEKMQDAGEHFDIGKIMAGMTYDDATTKLINKRAFDLILWKLSQMAWREVAVATGVQMGVSSEEISRYYLQTIESVLNNKTQYDNNSADIKPPIEPHTAAIKVWLADLYASAPVGE